MSNQPIKVKVSSHNIRVRVGDENKRKVVSSLIGITNFTDLYDVDIDNLDENKDNYVVVYSNTLGRFTIVDPDAVLSAASTSTGPQPGLPADFMNVLDIDLDNRIDVDGGFF